MVPVERLGEKNLMYAYYITEEIKEQLEMTNGNTVIIPTVRYVSKSIRFYPADEKSRTATLIYLKEIGHITSKLVSGKNIYVDVPNQKTIFTLCNRLLTLYNTRFVKPSEEKVKVDALANEQVEKLRKIIEVVAIQLSMSHPPHIIYIPIIHFPQEIQQSDVIGLLYKLDKDFGALQFGRMVGEKPAEKELEIRFATGDAMIKTFLELQKSVETRYQSIQAKKKHLPLPPAAPKPAPLEVIILESSKISIEKPEEEKQYKFPYKLPRGTKWENITIKFFDDDTLQIHVQGKEHTARYKEMGFAGKGGKPSVLWTFLRVLAMYSGEIKARDPKAVDKFKKQKQSLSEKLEDYFGLYDPFYPFQMKEKTNKAYRVKFTLLPPDNGFTFEKKEKISLLEKPVKKDPFADLGSYMGDIAPVVAQTEAITTDER